MFSHLLSHMEVIMVCRGGTNALAYNSDHYTILIICRGIFKNKIDKHVFCVQHVISRYIKNCQMCREWVFLRFVVIVLVDFGDFYPTKKQNVVLSSIYLWSRIFCSTGTIIPEPSLHAVNTQRRQLCVSRKHVRQLMNYISYLTSFSVFVVFHSPCIIFMVSSSAHIFTYNILYFVPY